MKILIFLLTFFCCIFNAQTFKGTYYLLDDNFITIKNHSTIISSEGKTKYTTYKYEKPQIKDKKIDKTVNKNGVIVEHVSEDFKIMTTNKLPEFYKDENNNQLLSRSFVVTKACYVKEDLDQMKWKISDKTIVHNGRNCNIATTHFRGKDWTVYFDTSIPFNVAPWKFHGLPGVVVYAITSDKMYVFELNDYEIIEENTVIKNPFSNENYITWNNYTQNYKEYLKKILKWSSSPGDDESGKIEINNQIENFGFSVVNVE